MFLVNTNPIFTLISLSNITIIKVLTWQITKNKIKATHIFNYRLNYLLILSFLYKLSYISSETYFYTSQIYFNTNLTR